MENVIIRATAALNNRLYQRALAYDGQSGKAVKISSTYASVRLDSTNKRLIFRCEHVAKVATS